MNRVRNGRRFFFRFFAVELLGVSASTIMFGSGLGGAAERTGCVKTGIAGSTVPLAATSGAAAGAGAGAAARAGAGVGAGAAGAGAGGAITAAAATAATAASATTGAGSTRGTGVASAITGGASSGGDAIGRDEKSIGGDGTNNVVPVELTAACGGTTCAVGASGASPSGVTCGVAAELRAWGNADAMVVIVVDSDSSTEFQTRWFSAGASPVAGLEAGSAAGAGGSSAARGEVRVAARRRRIRCLSSSRASADAVGPDGFSTPTDPPASPPL